MILDYTIQSPQERKAIVEKVLEEMPNPTERQLETLANYLVMAMEKEEKKQRKILTDNRMDTINRREMSFEGLAAQFQNGEDGIYHMITNDKNIIFRPKISITQKDIDEIPEIKALREAAEVWQAKLKNCSGHDAWVAKKAIIDLHKQQYIVKDSVRQPIVPKNITHSNNYVRFDETIDFDDNGYPIPGGISLMNPKVCSIILHNYSKLHENGWGDFESDTWYMMEDFDNLCTRAFANYPLLDKIIECKIDGLQSAEIQVILQNEFGTTYSTEYISSLWCKKIPNMIASEAEDEFLSWYYLNEKKGTYKKCSRCGEIKLLHGKYFSRNSTSKDGYYSICKKCRQAKMGKTH